MFRRQLFIIPILSAGVLSSCGIKTGKGIRIEAECSMMDTKTHFIMENRHTKSGYDSYLVWTSDINGTGEMTSTRSFVEPNYVGMIEDGPNQGYMKFEPIKDENDRSSDIWQFVVAQFDSNNLKWSSAIALCTEDNIIFAPI